MRTPGSVSRPSMLLGVHKSAFMMLLGATRLSVLFGEYQEELFISDFIPQR